MSLWKPLIYAATLAAGGADETNRFYARTVPAQTNAYLGQVIPVDVVVRTPQRPAVPELRSNESFHITALEAGAPTSETNTFLYRYAFRPLMEGTLSIPELVFSTDQTAVTSQPVVIQAQKPAPTDRMKLLNRLEKPEVYVGEPVRLITEWDSTYQLGALKAVDFHHPILTDKRFRILEPFDPQKESADKTTGLPVHGTRVLATRRNYEQNETRHQVLTFEKILIPKKSGTFTLPASALLCAAGEERDPNSRHGRRTAFQYPAYFDNTFFDQNLTDGKYQRIYTEAPELQLKVSPLPLENRPDLFNGMVGSYTLDVQAEPARVRVGEPVTLTITITARDTMENIHLPPLRHQPLLINRFDIPADRSLPERKERSKIYTQTIRPRSTDISEIPALELAFFDPASNAYQIARSAPLPLTVDPAEAIGVHGLSGGFQTRLQANPDGIRQNYEAPDMLHNRRPHLFGWAHPFWVFSLLLIPPTAAGLTVCAALFGKKRHQIERTAKAARAYRIYRRNATHITRNAHTKSEIYAELDRVLRVYFGDRLHLNPGALTFKEIDHHLAESGAKIELRQQLKELFERCEAYRFTTAYDEKANARQIVHAAAPLVKAAERRLK